MMKDERQILLAHRLALAEADMSEAEGYWNALVDMERVPQPIWNSVMVAIIVVYSRSFITSKSEGEALEKIPVGQLRLFGPGDEELRRLHDKLLLLRMKAAAHGDWEYHQTSYDYELTDLAHRRMARSLSRPDYTIGMDAHLFVRLFTHVRFRCATARLEIDRSHHRGKPDGEHGAAQ